MNYYKDQFRLYHTISDGQKSIMLNRLARLPLFIVVALYSNYSFSAISAVTGQTIQGTKPYFSFKGIKLNDTSNLAGFMYPDGSGGLTFIDTSKSIEENPSNVILIPDGINENQIVGVVGYSSTPTSLDTLVKIAGSDLRVVDVDGDATFIENTGAKGEISIVMKRWRRAHPNSQPINLM